MYTHCALQETDLSVRAHCDRDCIRTREISNSYQHIAALHVCMCVCMCVCSVCTVFNVSPALAFSYHFLYLFVLKFVLVRTLLHAVQRKCSLVMLC